MKVMFIVYHDIPTDARSQEILECAKKIAKETVLVSYSKPIEEAGCRCILTGNGKRKYFSFIREAIKAIKKENPNIVILHDNYTSIILRWLKKHRKNIFVIYDSSELYIDQKRDTIKLKIASFMNYFEKKYLKYADVVISANIERANIMKDYFQLRETPIVFDNVHRIDDPYDKVECEKKYGNLFNGNAFCIVYGGGISKQRMTLELANAVGELGNNYRLIITGNSVDRDKEELYSIMKKKGYSNIYYLGFIPRHELRYLFHKADVSVSIFQQDTVNNIYCASGKLFEGLFEGTPVLTSENPPLKRLCNEHKIGVSTSNFKDGILELERNYDYYYKNVILFTNSLDVKGRIDILAEQLVKKINSKQVKQI